ncbi:MAG TPA: RNA polymerase sigma factor [Gemmatimonadaceae bacterium]|nr:RNA polymerase sigma factor [Gemmatimonadaceae bacterium]
MTDSAVVRRVLEGDIEAFAILVDRYHDRYARFAVHMTGNREDAEEALQDAFVRAYRSLEQYEERELFGAWLRRIVINQCRTVVARRQRRDGRIADVEIETLELAPEGEDDAERTRERLDALLARLPAEQREAVLLKYGEGLTFEEMSILTGAGVSALKMRVTRALARLRAIVSEQMHVLL